MPSMSLSRHIVLQQIKPPNNSFNLNRETLSELWLKSLKIDSTLLWWWCHYGEMGPIMKCFYIKMLDIKLCSLNGNFM